MSKISRDAPSKTSPPTRRELLAEIDRLKGALSWLEPPFVDDSTPLAELRLRVRLALEDAGLVPRGGAR